MEALRTVRILFLMTAPPPALEGTEAVVQEAEALRSRFGGEIEFLVPGTRPRRGLPRLLYGLHRLRSLRRLDHEMDLHHVYHAELYPFPVLRFLRRPVVYTVVSSLAPGRIPPPESLNRLRVIAVPAPRDQALLVERGLARVEVVPAGIDTSQFEFVPIAGEGRFVLLAGSAPWTRGQFYSKGVDALLEVARQITSLRLVLLWRGWLLEDLRRKIQSVGLGDRVEVLTERVDVNQVLRRVHAAVVLADTAELVKAYPHSLLEALACGRPVIVSECIGMSDYVRRVGCGRVVAGVNPSDLRLQIEELRHDYGRCQDRARRHGMRDFSRERVLEAYGRLYESALKSPGLRRVPGEKA